MTRVFPLPAPARISTGPSVVSTASRCCGLRLSRKDKGKNRSGSSLIQFYRNYFWDTLKLAVRRSLAVLEQYEDVRTRSPLRLRSVLKRQSGTMLPNFGATLPNPLVWMSQRLCDDHHTNGSAPSMTIDQPRSGARMQPRAQALGTDQQTFSPERAKEILPQTCGNIVVHLIFSTKGRRPLIKLEIRADLFALSRRHHSRTARHGADRQRHRRPRSRAGTDAASAVRRRNRACDQDQFIALGTRQMACRICLAGWVRTIRRERIERSCGNPVHRDRGGAAPKMHVSGRIPGVLKKEQRCL